MTYQTFVNEVEKRLNEVMNPRKIYCKQKSTVKNNGVIRQGIQFFDGKMEAKTVPTIYMEAFYQRYKESANEDSFEELLIEICLTYEECISGCDSKLEEVTDFEKMKGRIVFSVINRQRNTERLNMIPFIPYLDLAIIFHIMPYETEETDEIGSAIITNALMEEWGCNEKYLYGLARENTLSYMGCEFLSLDSLAKKVIPEEMSEESETGIYVVTNRKKWLGAGIFLYPEILKKIADFFDSDFYALPSSIHEWLVLPSNYNMNKEELTSIVQEVNKNAVLEEEVLSDRAYYYSREKGMLE